MKQLNCILLIDDNVNDNFFHSVTIQEANAALQIKTVIDGEKALEYFDNAEKDPIQYPFPDLVFLDINMPKINGFEFLEKAKKRKIINSGKPVVIVMLTSSLNPNDEQMAKQKFANEIRDYKNKPLTTEMLMEIISKYF